MTNTDSTPFMDVVASISLRENERGVQVGSGWDPHWHQPTDLFATFSDKDFRLGLNAAQTTLGAVADLTAQRTIALTTAKLELRSSNYEGLSTQGERRLVPEVGVEPTHPCGYGILSPARLPVSPLRLGPILRQSLDASCGTCQLLSASAAPKNQRTRGHGVTILAARQRRTGLRSIPPRPRCAP